MHVFSIQTCGVHAIWAIGSQIINTRTHAHRAKAARNTIIAETLDIDAGIAADATERICYQIRMYA